MTKPTAITQESLLGLPRQALIAFAARTARRVLPAFHASWPEAPKEHVQAVEYAVKLAEDVGAGIVAGSSSRVSDAGGLAGQKAGRASREAEAANFFAAARAADAAYHAADAVYDSDLRTIAANAAGTTVSAAGAFIAYLLPTSGGPGGAFEDAASNAADVLQNVMAADVALLRQFAARDHWTDATPVPPEWFGPLWPNGEPPGWPTDDPAGLVTAVELKKLTLRAIFAFGGRCARRVLPLVAGREAQETRPVARLATEAAIRFVEGIAAADRLPDAVELERLAGVRLADVKGVIDQLAPRIAIDSAPVAAMLAAANAVLALAHAGADRDSSDEAFCPPGHLYPKKPNPVVAATAAGDHAGYAAAAWAGLPEPEIPVEPIIMPAMRQDYELLRRAAQAESWTDDTPVSPDFFGRLWPEGPPQNWPGPERSSDKDEVAVTIDVPEGVSDDDVLALVAGLVVQADAVHRAYGGHGLEVKEGNVEVDREALLPSPTGGRP